jgi:hypothetical protein
MQEEMQQDRKQESSQQVQQGSKITLMLTHWHSLTLSPSLHLSLSFNQIIQPLICARARAAHTHRHAVTHWHSLPPSLYDFKHARARRTDTNARTHASKHSHSKLQSATASSSHLPPSPPLIPHSQSFSLCIFSLIEFVQVKYKWYWSGYCFIAEVRQRERRGG